MGTGRFCAGGQCHTKAGPQEGKTGAGEWANHVRDAEKSPLLGLEYFGRKNLLFENSICNFSASNSTPLLPF